MAWRASAGGRCSIAAPSARGLSLFDFSGDLYGRSIDVAFIDWIRDEAVFASVDDLTRQMQDDARRAREALARAGDVFPPI